MSKCLLTLPLCIALVALVIPPSTAQQNRLADIKADSALDQRVQAGVQARPASGSLMVWPSSLVLDGNSRVTWEDNPSLMDASWRQWPSLTDF